jgi:hypothetical protein
MFDNLLKGMFGKVKNGMCRLSMTGEIAVKTTDGYKSYNLKTDRLVNCNQFTFDGMDEMFFVIPTNSVKVGDVILVKGTPRCVISVEESRLTALNYETNTVETIIPERHVFMGNTYFYGKIVSMFGNFAKSGKSGTNKIMKMYMLSQMMQGFSGSNGSSSGMNFGGGDGNNMMTMLMMSNLMGEDGMGISDMFSGIFDDDEENPLDAVVDAVKAAEDGTSDNGEPASEA